MDYKNIKGQDLFVISSLNDHSSHATEKQIISLCVDLMTGYQEDDYGETILDINRYQNYHFYKDVLSQSANFKLLSSKKQANRLFEIKELFANEIGIIQPFNYNQKVYYVALIKYKQGLFIYSDELKYIGNGVNVRKGCSFGNSGEYRCAGFIQKVQEELSGVQYLEKEDGDEMVMKVMDVGDKAFWYRIVLKNVMDSFLT